MRQQFKRRVVDNESEKYESLDEVIDKLETEGHVEVSDIIELDYNIKAAPFGTKCVTLQYWPDDVLDRFNICLIEMPH